MKNQEAASHSSQALVIRRQNLPSEMKPHRKTSPAGVQAASTVSGDGREELIRQRAYSLYQARNCENGHDLEDWFQAEAQIRQSQVG